MVKYGVVFLLSLFFTSTFAAETDGNSTASIASNIQQQLKQKMKTTIGLDIISVQASPMQGLVELVTDQGLFYSSVDGQFLIQGKLYGIGDNAIVNHTETSLADIRLQGLAQFTEDMIVFPAKDEKYVVTVFTDITCGYCRQMHAKMDEYNAKGITIRYMAYPRAGIKDQMGEYTQGFKDLRSIWCHEDANMAMTKAKAGSSIALRVCDKKIAEQLAFGRQIGVNSTPALVLPDGTLMPGYRKPDDLLKILQNMATDN